MHIILINAASRRTEHDFDSIEKAAGSCGPKMPLICDGKAGHFEMWPDPKTEAVFVETDPTFAHFAFAHLPERLQRVSKQAYALAEFYVLELPVGHERTKALDELLASKDAAVRAALPR
jgi:hypothetical protein